MHIALAAYRRILSTLPRYSRVERLRQIAQRLSLSKSAHLRLEWFLYYQKHHNVTLTCRHFGIARKTFYKWQKRFDTKNLRTLEDYSRAPQRKRQRMITPIQEERIVALRKQFIRYGKEKLVKKYFQAYQEVISAWQIQLVIMNYQLYYHPAKNARTQAKRLRAEKKKRITELKRKKRPGFLFCIDTVVRSWHGKKRYIVTAIDAWSKIAFAHMYSSHSSATAADFLIRLRHLTNGKIENIQSDNGTEFHKHFDQACKKLTIHHYWSRVKTPKDNPVNERFNRTLQDEFIALGNMIVDSDKFNQKLTEWLIEYNFYRPHQALGYVSPMCFIQQKKDLLPMYSSYTDT